MNNLQSKFVRIEEFLLNKKTEELAEISWVKILVLLDKRDLEITVVPSILVEHCWVNARINVIKKTALQNMKREWFWNIKKIQEMMSKSVKLLPVPFSRWLKTKDTWQNTVWTNLLPCLTPSVRSQYHLLLSDEEEDNLMKYTVVSTHQVLTVTKLLLSLVEQWEERAIYFHKVLWQTMLNTSNKNLRE